jgi:hypothetical protein
MFGFCQRLLCATGTPKQLKLELFGMKNTGIAFVALSAGLVISSTAMAGPLSKDAPARDEPVGQSEVGVAQAAQQATIGNSSGQLGTGDAQLATGEFQDTWEFQGRQGQTVRISLNSSEFDTYLMVRGPAGTSADNDDRGEGDLNSEVVVTFPVDATYQIVVTSYQAGEVGNYVLNLAETTGGSVPTAGGGSPGEMSVAAGATVQGSLASGDSTLNSGEFADTWTYEGSAGERLTINMSSSDFDTYLMLRSNVGLNEDNDDIVAGNTDSTLSVTLPAAGTYRIIATSYSPGDSGNYTLALSSSATPSSGGSSTLVSGQHRRETLDASDPMRAGRQYFDVYTFQGAASQRALIEAESRRFTTSLRLIYPNGTEQTADAGGGGNQASLSAILPVNGEYTVHVSSIEPAVTGNYDLTATLSGVSATTPAPAATGSALTAGTETEGRLQRGDTQLDTGEFFDSYTISGQAGDAVTIEMVSTDLDAYLFVRGPQDFARDNDDGPGMGLNSRIEIVFPATGEYSVVATSYAAGEVGSYRLTVGEGTAVSASASGNVFALMGGITTYQQASQLAGCADDARLLFQTLQETGILAPQSAMLTDGMMTRAALREAFTRIGQSMTADDVFIFFFSGHGNQIAGREFDGSDETIVLYDGEVTDDEMAELFDLIPGRMAIIALDSCFSGGFARDVISVQNRMGIFSSEEDVTSNVAVRFSAGGFLSYFLREGLGGAADIEPSDGVITAGELSQYLRQQWAQHMLNERTETADSESAWQNLVIDRGSVKVSDVIVYRSER